MINVKQIYDSLITEKDKDELGFGSYMDYVTLYKDSQWRVYIPKTQEAFSLITKGATWDKTFSDFNPKYGNTYLVYNKTTPDKKYLIYFYNLNLLDTTNANISDFNIFPKNVLNAILKEELKNKNPVAHNQLIKFLSLLFDDTHHSHGSAHMSSVKAYKDFNKLILPTSVLKDLYAPTRIIYNPKLITQAVKFNVSNSKAIYKNGDKLETVLNAACAYDNLPLVKLLLGASAKSIINVANHHNVTPLHSAASVNNIDMIKLLLKSGASKSLDMIETEHNRTPLFIAVQHDNTEAVKLMLAAGKLKTINEADAKGDTMLYIASTHKNAEIAELLIKRGANPEVDEKTKAAYDALVNKDIPTAGE